MKKVKFAFWILVFGLVGLVIFQNRSFFMAENTLSINLGVYHYETPLLPNAFFFVALFLMGILLSYFLGLFKHFKDAKTIKLLKAKEVSLVETVSSLEKQLATQQSTAETMPAASTEEKPIEDKPVEVVAEVK